jgi:hypothetical protein
MINDVQSLWRTAVNDALEPSDYESCHLGGEDPTLATYETAFTGSGYAPSSLVTITGHSLPMTLGRAHTDAQGHFAAAFDPRPLGVGAHHIVAAGVGPTGAPRTITWTYTVRVTGVRHTRSLAAVRAVAISTVAVAVALAVTLLLRARRRRRRRSLP